MQKIIPVVIAVIYKDNKFFLTERRNTLEETHEFGKKTLWHFPGGELEYGEELDSAIMREIKEETSLTISVQKQLPRVYSSIRSRWHGLLIPFLCTVEGDSNVTLNFESTSYGWFAHKEIHTLHTLPFVTEIAKDALVLLKQS